MKKIITIFLLLFSLCSFGQSETHNMITYDTTIFYNFVSGTKWMLRITRPVDYFTPGAADTAGRPAIITMPGAGEVGTDTNFLTNYGPHYWLKNGWDGGIQLGNGRHYPILITICQGSANTRGGFTAPMLDTVIRRYHLKRNSIHLGGLSEGGWVWGTMIQYSATSGDDHAASLVTSFVNLEGVPANNSFAPGRTFPTGYGHWAKKYNGHYFSLYGTNDTQHNSGGYSVGGNINDSAAGHAFTSFEVAGGGGHCCWNDMYNPNYNLWLTGNLVGTKAGLPNFPGNYYEPSSIFQWMLRQGDTTLVGAPSGNKKYIKAITGEYVGALIDTLGNAFALGTNEDWLGIGTTGWTTDQLGTPIPIAGAPGVKFKGGSGGLHYLGLIDSSGNVWMAGENFQGQLGNGTFSHTNQLTFQKITQDSTGSAFTGIKEIYCYYSQNAWNGTAAVKDDGTVWIWGATMNGLKGNGRVGDTSSYPVRVVIPGGRFVTHITCSDYLLIQCSDGTVWATGNNTGRAQNRGTGNSDGLNFYQLPGLPTNIADVQGGNNFSYALDSAGHLYGWGFYGGYMGIGHNGFINNPIATPRPLDTALLLPAPVKKIYINAVSSHAILTDGTLWGWGDNAVGTVGNGQELDYTRYTTNPAPYGGTTPAPFNWDLGAGELLVQKPIQITAFNDWENMYQGTSFVFYVYAQRSDGTLYSWGRNKGGPLGNGIVSCDANIVATYPNSWDVTNPRIINPFGLSTSIKTSSPYCIANPDSAFCNLDCPSSNQPPLSNAGPDKTIALPINSITISGSGSPISPATSIFYVWNKNSGPGTTTIINSTTPTPTFSGLVQGSYAFRLKVTDNNNLYSLSVVNVTVTNVPGTGYNIIIKKRGHKIKYIN